MHRTRTSAGPAGRIAPSRWTASAATILVAALVAACGSDGGSGPPDDIGLPASGQVTGSVASGDTATARFVAGRSGETRVALCGPANTNFDLHLRALGRSAATPSNCESLTFPAAIGTTYALEVVATAGAGPFNICYGPANAQPPCTATVPVASDSTVPAGYYQSAEGRTGTALIAALHSIVASQRTLGYTSARDSLYAFVADPDGDDAITDVYVGRTAAPVYSRATAFSAGFNAEHTWPQSRGANEDPALSDLNILFPSDSAANSRRSNYPFGEVVRDTTYVTPVVAGQPPSERSVLGRDAAGRLVFEPRDSQKGDVARAILYFYVRYNAARTPSYSLSNFNVEESTVIKWARQDPPDEAERARNRMVYRAQGNRNPFIDRPDFLDAIGDFPN